MRAYVYLIAYPKHGGESRFAALFPGDMEVYDYCMRLAIPGIRVLHREPTSRYPDNRKLQAAVRAKRWGLWSVDN
jgi:hypothetical protein